MARALAILLLALLLALQHARAWRAVRAVRHARDYATYHYAVEVALDGGDPYDTRALSRRARAERTRRAVHPYLYPPPFLLGMLWSAPLDLRTAYRAWFWLNEGFLAATLLALRALFRPSWLALALAAATLTPIADSAKMGQANLPVLLLVVAGLALLGRGRERAGGALVGAAAMAKMSPALLLAWWGARGRWRPVFAALCAAVALTAISLPLVRPDAQLRFFTEVLPSFSDGRYHGLGVPISLPANHSIPDLFHRLWPGPNEHALSRPARLASSATALALLVALAAASRPRRDALGEAALAGAWVVLMLLVPVYTYEHHLSMLLLPGAVLASAVERRRLPVAAWPLAALAWFLVAWPLAWLRAAQHAFPAAEAWLRESKFLGLVLVGLLCVAVALRSPRRA